MRNFEGITFSSSENHDSQPGQEQESSEPSLEPQLDRREVARHLQDAELSLEQLAGVTNLTTIGAVRLRHIVESVIKEDEVNKTNKNNVIEEIRVLEETNQPVDSALRSRLTTEQDVAFYSVATESASRWLLELFGIDIDRDTPRFVEVKDNTDDKTYRLYSLSKGGMKKKMLRQSISKAEELRALGHDVDWKIKWDTEFVTKYVAKLRDEANCP
jgi:hypothetical protein